MVNRAAPAAAPFGLLETLRCVDGAVALLELHQRRLARSWPRFFGGRPSRLDRIAAAAIAGSRGGAALVRVTFLGERGGPARATVEARPLPAPPRQVAVAIAASPRGDPVARRRHKCADRRWVEKLSAAGAFETLVWDDDGGLLEGTRSNLFLLRGSELTTPGERLGLVPGVVRARILRIAPQLGLAVREARIAPADLRGAAGLLLTGSGVGVVAVTECDGRAVGSRAAAALAARLSRAAFGTE